MKSVDSSAIAAVSYNKDAQQLRVKFLRTGTIYDYFGVTPYLYDAFNRAPSKGRFFNSAIRKLPSKKRG